MKTNAPVLTINGGSSSIKFALFEAGTTLVRLLAGQVEGIGLSQGKFSAKGSAAADTFSHSIVAPDHAAGVNVLMDWIAARFPDGGLGAVGHRVVHGGPDHWQPQQITVELLAELRKLSPFDPEHLPEEILLAQAFHQRFPSLPQVACFDTAFHHGLPRVARLLPIPRRFSERGVRRYGFHGLSCEFLMGELGRVAGEDAANGRVIIAHLGNGASLTAVHGGKSMDTSMGFTPSAGVPMSSRSGDLDPGLGWYLAQSENVSAEEFQRMINHESGLLGISGTSADMRELMAREMDDIRAADAVAVFCYQVKKFIGAYAAALGGLDTLVFAGGIGENAFSVRQRICEGLGFLGLALDEARNQAGAPVISSAGSSVTVRMIRTDEEQVIAKSVIRALTNLSPKTPEYIQP